MLKKLDPRRAAGIEQKNPRRLVRAIEIARTLGAVPELKRESAYDALWIGIKPPHEILSQNIERRVRAMVRRGLLAETEKLLQQGVSEKRIREFGFEYSAALDVIAKKAPRAALAPRIISDTKKYARRQMRWWKRNEEIRWISNSASRQSEQIAKTFL